MDFTRKPDKLSDCKDTCSLKEAQDYILKTKIISAEDDLNIAFNYFDPSIEYFDGESPQIFILTFHNGKKYLVDKQGYNYCRYMIEIK